MTTSLYDALLADGPDLDAPETRDRWQIDSDELAGWALRKLEAALSEQARIDHEADREIVRLQAWRDREKQIVQGDVDFFHGRLVEYRRTLEAKDPSLPKTYKLPWGNLTRRGGRERTIVPEQDAFVAWALDNNPEALDYKPRVSHMADWPRKDNGDGTASICDPLTGEVVPGVQVVRGDDTYDAKPFTTEPF